MTKQMLGNPKLEVTKLDDVKAGFNNIVVDSVQYANQEMIMEKDMTIKMQDNGVSYLAVTQWWVASLNPPHLKAMIPWEGLNDMYREVAFHGGIPDTGFYRFWYDGLIKRWPETHDIENLQRMQKTHTLFFVGVKKLSRQGEEINFPDFNHIENGQVATGWLRVSHRELDMTKSTQAQPWLKHERELKLKDNEIVPVEIEILPSGTLFKAGESIQVIIKASEIVKGNSTPGMKTRYEHDETVSKGTHNIHTGGKYNSHLLVPVIPNI